MACKCNTNKVLDTEIYWDDAGGETTLRESFKLLLKTLFREVDGFSGKRPLGNSSWTYEIAAALINSGLLVGETDEAGYEPEFEYADFDEVIDKAIEAL